MSVFEEILPTLKAMKDKVRRSQEENDKNDGTGSLIHLHHAPLFGMILGLLGMDTMVAQRAFLFINLRDLLSAATRLGVVGPLEAAQMMHRVSGEAESILGRYANKPVRDAYQTSPIIDVIQGVHDDLFSRLFRS